MTWEKVRLENLCTIVRGSSPRPQGDARYYGGNIPRLMIEDLTRDGKYVTPQVDSLTEEGAKLSRPMKKGDLVITVSGRTGVPAILAVDACIHDGFVGFRDLSDKINIDYLFHYLSSLTAITSQQAVGAIFKNLTTEQLKNLEIPLPPLPIQKRIAEILDTADALRRKDEALLKKYDELAQAIFIDMFGDPVKNEKGWEVKKLGEVLSTKSQNGLYITEENYIEDGIEMVHMSDAFYQKVSTGSLKKVNISQTELEKYKLTNDSILVARRSLNYEGAVKPCLVDTKGQNLVYESSLIRLNTDKNKILPIYLFYFLSNEGAKKKFVMKYVTKSTISGINNENLNNINVLVPPIELQKRYEITIELIQRSININIEEKFVSSNLFNSLLQKAFNGELVA